jgi:hypothetical protein
MPPAELSAPSTFTPMTDATFNETDGLFCPFCRSRDLAGDRPFYFTSEGLTRYNHCQHCHRHWTEHFQRIGYRATSQ